MFTLSNVSNAPQGQTVRTDGDDDLNDLQRVVLEELEKGRCNPYYLQERIKERLDREITRQHLNRVLSRLSDRGLVQRVTRGLYTTGPAYDADA